MEKIAIVGIGKWGRVLLKELSDSITFKYFLGAGSTENAAWVKENYPNIRKAKNLKQILNDSEISSVIIATPISSHFEIAKRSLIAKKHVFVEKPACTTEQQAKELLRIAKKK